MINDLGVCENAEQRQTAKINPDKMVAFIQNLMKQSTEKASTVDIIHCCQFHQVFHIGAVGFGKYPVF